jgi:hypothetical protein
MAWPTITADELAEHVWETVLDEPDVSLDSILSCGWPFGTSRALQGSDRPLAVDGRQMFELVGALAKQAVADGMSASEVMRAFADGLPS